VLEHSGARQPLFWMFVKDRAPTRDFVQLFKISPISPSADEEAV
jgi:hypothetical protein